MTDRLRAVGRTMCEDRGYDVSAPGKPWLPTYLAEPTADATPFVPRSTNTRVAVEPLDTDELTPTTLLSRLKNNSGHERFSLFVVDGELAGQRIHEVLHDPPLVAAEDDEGRRTFYNGPDRIPLAEGGYAAVRTDTVPDRLVWREAGDGDDRSLLLVDEGEQTRAGEEGSQPVAEEPTESRVVASLVGVDDLACPSAGAFPYSYRRDPEDKRFRVRSRDGRVVGVYDGVADMRANAYVPLPMPLIPEHVFSGVSSIRDEWGVLVVDEDAHDVEGEQSVVDVSDAARSSVRLVTAGTVE